MKQHINKTILILAGLLMESAAHASLFNSGMIGLAIPDDSSIGITDTITVSGVDGSITNISVSVDIGATDGGYAFNGDLYLYLQHGDNLSILLNRVGKTAANPYGYGDNGFDVIFTLTGADIHSADFSGGPATGVWGADGRLVDPDLVLDTDARSALLDVFLGSQANGDWTLFAADMAGGGTAKLNNWSLTVEAIPEPMVLSFVAIAGGSFLFVRRLIFKA